MTTLTTKALSADLDGEAGIWGRRRLLTTLALAAGVAVLVAVGLGYALYLAMTSTAPTPEGQSQLQEGVAEAGIVVDDDTTGPALRDAIAAAPMLQVSPQAGRAGTPASQPGPGIPIPAAGEVGAAGVATGYPRSPEGAVAQLAAIAVSVLQGMSVEHTNAVHEAWSAPRAVPVEDWELMSSVLAFLGSASGPQANSPLSSVVVTPVAAQVKGVDGPDWTLACVLFDVEARVVSTARVAYGHCARMQWDGSGAQGRWVIGEGEEPARAPSTWPGTVLAQEAGWLTWVPAEDDQHGGG